MDFISSRRFERHFKRLSLPLKEQFRERKDLFTEGRRHPLLNDHSLHEPYAGCRSFSVTGDVRVIYQLKNDMTCLLLDIGTHHELYGS